MKLELIIDRLQRRLRFRLASYMDKWKAVDKEERVRIDQDDIHAADFVGLSEQLVAVKRESCRRVVLLCNRIGREGVLCAFTIWVQRIRQQKLIIETPCSQQLRKMVAERDEQLRSKDRELILLKNALKMQLLKNGERIRPVRSPLAEKRRAAYSTQYDAHEWLQQHN
jgi:ribosomal protein L29